MHIKNKCQKYFCESCCWNIFRETSLNNKTNLYLKVKYRKEDKTNAIALFSKNIVQYKYYSKKNNSTGLHSKIQNVYKCATAARAYKYILFVTEKMKNPNALKVLKFSPLIIKLINKYG